MSRRKHYLFPILLGSSLVVCFPVAANDWYAGLQVGSQRTDTGKLAADYHPVITFTSSATSDKDVYRVSGGRRLLPWLATELGYTQYAIQRLDHFGSPNPAGPPAFLRRENRTAVRETNAWGADLVATWPPEGAFYVKASAGIQRAKVKLRTEGKSVASFIGGGSSEFNLSSSNTTNAARYSVGGGWRVNETWDLSLTYERLGNLGSEFVRNQDGGTGRIDQSTVWAGLAYRF